MHDQDKNVLEQMCGGVINEEARRLHAVYQAAWSRINSGPLPLPLLMVIAVQSGSVEMPVKQPHPFDEVPFGTYVSVREEFSAAEQYQGVFMSIGTGLYDKLVEVAYYGDKYNRLYVPADRVRPLMTTPDWASPQPPPPPVPQEDPKKNDLAPEPVKHHPLDRLALGTKVAIAVPGKSLASGYFYGISDTGEVMVCMDKKPQNSKDRLKRFNVEDVRVEHDDTGVPIVEIDKVKDLVTMASAPGGVE